MGKNIDEMSTEELETEAGVIVKERVRKQVIEELLYSKYKRVGK